MKTIAIALLSFVALNTKAQIVTGKLAGNDGAANKYYDFYDNSGKKIKNAGEEDVKGTPMLREDWGAGVVKFKNGKEFVDTSMNFSLFENKLFFSKDNKIFVVSVPIDEFVISYKNEKNTVDKYHFKCGYPIINSNDVNTFYEILYEGQGLQLLRCQHKKINDTYSYGSAREREFTLSQSLFVYQVKENKINEINSTVNSVKKTLPQCSAYIDEYTSMHKVNTKDLLQLTLLMAYIDSKATAAK